MTEQIYLAHLEKGIKIIRTYDVMINQQQNYKTLPHYMKVFGDFCMNYLKYKTSSVGPEINHMEKVDDLLKVCEENQIPFVSLITENKDLIQQCKDLHYTDVAECMKEMPTTMTIIVAITKDINME